MKLIKFKHLLEINYVYKNGWIIMIKLKYLMINLI